MLAAGRLYRAGLRMVKQQGIDKGYGAGREWENGTDSREAAVGFGIETEGVPMASTEEEGAVKIGPVHTSASLCGSWSVVGSCVRWVTAALLAAVIGTWLVWFAAYVQRQQNEEDIRSACRRLMPETAERCFDTVVIQRGGVRR